MKVLIVAMRSIHTIRWVSQLENSGHEVHWFDILNGGHIDEWPWVTQHTNWRYKFGDFRGRFFLKKYLPKLHNLFENDVEKEFQKLLQIVKPGVVQSLVMYNCCVPIFSVMQRNKHIKWIYSAWGNDLFYYRNIPAFRKDILKVLPKIDYMFADCERDITIAKELGFQGEALGVFPGGGGYKINEYIKFVKPLSERYIILVKGYEQRFGRALNVIKALVSIKMDLTDYRIVVFGADEEFHSGHKSVEGTDFIEVKSTLKHQEVLKLMGESIMYIGNSISDGMPNTLLEAIIMGAFPIQSNPGNATAEIIENRTNGLLIEDAENSEEIKKLILSALTNDSLIKNAFDINQELKYSLGFELIKEQVLKAYNQIEKEL
ncbi:MAG: glycosyltransferase involved in cell wall biosynthesis [Saprospiraceae bacterium]|jgi:glycosyltransferase involved in cell wall biosynthesis